MFEKSLLSTKTRVVCEIVENVKNEYLIERDNYIEILTKDKRKIKTVWKYI